MDLLHYHVVTMVRSAELICHRIGSSRRQSEARPRLQIREAAR